MDPNDPNNPQKLAAIMEFVAIQSQFEQLKAQARMIRIEAARGFPKCEKHSEYTLFCTGCFMYMKASSDYARNIKEYAVIESANKLMLSWTECKARVKAAEEARKVAKAKMKKKVKSVLKKQAKKAAKAKEEAIEQALKEATDKMNNTNL